MKNFVQEGTRVPFVAPSGGVVAGRGVLVGQMFLVAAETVAQGVRTVGVAYGVVNIAKTEALAITAGDAVYWDDAAKVVNKTSASQKEVGFAVTDAGNPSPTVVIQLCPSVRTSVAA